MWNYQGNNQRKEGMAQSKRGSFSWWASRGMVLDRNETLLFWSDFWNTGNGWFHERLRRIWNWTNTHSNRITTGYTSHFPPWYHSTYLNGLRRKKYVENQQNSRLVGDARETLEAKEIHLLGQGLVSKNIHYLLLVYMTSTIKNLWAIMDRPPSVGGIGMGSWWPRGLEGLALHPTLGLSGSALRNLFHLAIKFCEKKFVRK